MIFGNLYKLDIDFNYAIYKPSGQVRAAQYVTEGPRLSRSFIRACLIFAFVSRIFHRDQKTALFILLLKKGKDPFECRPMFLITF